MKSSTHKLRPLKYSSDEIYDRMENGLCIFCEEHDTLGHQELKHKGFRIVVIDCKDDHAFDDKELVSVDLDQEEGLIKTVAEAKLDFPLGQNVEHLAGGEGQTNSSQETESSVIKGLVSTYMIQDGDLKPESESNSVQVLHQIEAALNAHKSTGITTHHIAHQLVDKMHLTVQKELSKEVHLQLLNTSLCICENNKVISRSSEASHVWEPGGVLVQRDDCKWLGMTNTSKDIQEGTTNGVQRPLISIRDNILLGPQKESSSNQVLRQTETFSYPHRSTSSTISSYLCGLSQANHVWKPGELMCVQEQRGWLNEAHRSSRIMEITPRFYGLNLSTKTLYPPLTDPQSWKRKLGSLTMCSSVGLEEGILKLEICFCENTTLKLLLCYLGLELQKTHTPSSDDSVIADSFVKSKELQGTRKKKNKRSKSWRFRFKLDEQPLEQRLIKSDGFSVERDKWKWPVKCYKRTERIRVIQRLCSMWWKYDKMVELTRELQQQKTYLQGVALRELDRLPLCSFVDIKTWLHLYSYEFDIEALTSALRICEKNKMIGHCEQANRVWNPGGLLCLQAQWDCSRRGNSDSRVLKIAQRSHRTGLQAIILRYHKIQEELLDVGHKMQPRLVYDEGKNELKNTKSKMKIKQNSGDMRRVIFENKRRFKRRCEQLKRMKRSHGSLLLSFHVNPRENLLGFISEARYADRGKGGSHLELLTRQEVGIYVNYNLYLVQCSLVSNIRIANTRKGANDVEVTVKRFESLSVSFLTYELLHSPRPPEFLLSTKVLILSETNQKEQLEVVTYITENEKTDFINKEDWFHNGLVIREGLFLTKDSGSVEEHEQLEDVATFLPSQTLVILKIFLVKLELMMCSAYEVFHLKRPPELLTEGYSVKIKDMVESSTKISSLDIENFILEDKDVLKREVLLQDLWFIIPGLVFGLVFPVQLSLYVRFEPFRKS